jgi:hypothetical protein
MDTFACRLFACRLFGGRADFYYVFSDFAEKMPIKQLSLNVRGRWVEFMRREIIMKITVGK